MQNPHNLNQIPISSHPSTSIPLESPLSHVLPVYLNEVNEGALAGSDSCHSGHSGRSGRSLRSYEIPERRETEDTAILKDAARPGTSVGRGVTRTDSARRNLNGDQSRTEYLARYRKDGRKYDDDEIKRPGGAVLPPLPLISPLSSHFGERTGSHVDTVQERYYGDDKSGHPSTLSTVTLPHSPSQTTQTNGSRYSPYSPYPPNTTENPSFSPQTIYSETTEDYFKPKSLADLDELGAGGLVSPLRLSDGRSVGLGFGDKPRRKVLGRVESSTRTGWSRLLPVSKWTRLFLLLVLLETIVDLGIQFYLWRRFTHVIDSDQATVLIRENQRRFPVYLAIFAMAHLWQLILAIDGAYYRNTIQIIGLSIFNALFLAWAALQITEIKAMFASTIIIIDSTIRNSLYNDVPVTALTGSMLGIIAFVEIGFILLSWRVFKEMGWQIYHDLGADLRIKAYHFHYQIFVCILRFAAFFFAGFGIQFIWLVLYQAEDAEYYATIALLPVSMVVLLWGAYAAHRESHILMSGFMVALLGAGGYFTYKTVRVYQAKETFELVYKSITIFSALSIVVTVLALVWSGIVMFNFGKGLKRQRERMSQKKKDKRAQRKMAAKADPSTPGVDESEIEMKRHRMSID